MDFDFLQTKIQTFLEAKKQSAYLIEDSKYKLPLSDAIFCAQDTIRNRKFFEAIGRAVTDLKKDQPSLTVVDAGSGTGILGIFALFSGADKCYFLENNPYSLKLSQELIHHLGLSDKSVFRECDASTYQLPELFDLMISETLSAGFVHEDFPRIVNHLKSFAKSHAIIVPEAFDAVMIEQDSSGNELHEQTFHFDSLEGFNSQKLELNPKTRTLKWTMDANLYDGLWFRSGESSSFLNERKMDIRNEKHPFFEMKQFANIL